MSRTCGRRRAVGLETLRQPKGNSVAVVAGTTWRSQNRARACLLVCLDAVLVSCQLVRKFIEAEGCDPLRREVGVEGCVNYEVARFGKSCVGRVSGHKRGRGTKGQRAWVLRWETKGQKESSRELGALVRLDT